MPQASAAPNVNGPPACRTVDELVRAVPLGDAAKALAREARSAAEFLQLLAEQRLDVDAIRVLAYALPVRQSLWWALLCTWHGLNGSPAPEQDLALQVAVRWVREPTPERRRTAEAVAQSRVLQDAADCCARAAGLAGQVGSPGDPLTPRDTPGAARLVLAAVF